MQILVVDDNANIRDLVQQVLQIEGHKVAIARDGLEALQRHAALLPDLVLCDVNLPGIDGWEVCRRIKAERDVPVILVTVRAERADIERSAAAGADDHLPKPFDLYDLLQRIEQIKARVTL